MPTLKKTLEEVLARCEKKNLAASEVMGELRNVIEDTTLLDDWQAQRVALVDRMGKALQHHNQINATVETGVAITDYHRNVVMPLVSTLLHALIESNLELALVKRTVAKRTAA